MANLLIEIGNTALKAAWAEGKTLGKTVRYQGEKLHGFLIGTLLAKERPDVLVLASVRDIPEEDIREISERCGQLVLIDRNHPAIMRAYGLPEYLSPSRAASIIAARELFKGKPCLVFDFGTVLSIDSIASDGAYQGGNLSLGCRTRFKALTGRTILETIHAKRLALVEDLLRKPDLSIQAIAIRAGFVDASSLCSLFRRAYGCSMGEWRARRKLTTLPPQSE